MFLYILLLSLFPFLFLFAKNFSQPIILFFLFFFSHHRSERCSSWLARYILRVSLGCLFDQTLHTVQIQLHLYNVHVHWQLKRTEVQAKFLFNELSQLRTIHCYCNTKGWTSSYCFSPAHSYLETDGYHITCYRRSARGKRSSHSK